MTRIINDKGGSSNVKVILITAAISIFLSGATLLVLDQYFHFGHGHEAGETAEAGGEEEAPIQLYSCGMHPWIISEEPGDCPICGMELTPKRDSDDQAGADSGERVVVYWRAPMDPTEIYEEPGKSKMGMDLVPVYEDELIGGVEVSIDPVTQQNMGIRTAIVELMPLAKTIRTYGRVTYDETRTTQVSPRFSGWVEKLHIDFTGQRVKKGQPLFEIYAPELISAQEEYLAAYKNLGGNGELADLLGSAKRRLTNFGVSNSEIRALERAGKVSRTVTIRAPFSGVVTAKTADEGSFVKRGSKVYTVSDLGKVWVEANVYEYELPWVREGQKASISLAYLPGRDYTAKVAFIYPYLQKKTRDSLVRLELDNPGFELKPEMFADVRIEAATGEYGLVIPSEAVLRSGEQNLVFVVKGQGKFAPRKVTLGLSLDGGRVQVLTGLAEGEEIVTSGQFLLDSESKLKEAVQKMLEMKSGGSKAKKQAEEDDFFDDMEEESDDFFDDLEDS